MKSKPLVGSLFRISAIKRKTIIGNPAHADNLTVMVVDNVGIFVAYNSDIEVTPEDVRRHQRIGFEVYCIIQAENVSEAIAKFYAEQIGANVGGPGEEYKALRIDRDKPIVELPFCEKIGVTKNGKFTCGEPMGEDKLYDTCIIDRSIGSEIDEDCPMDNLYDDHDEETPTEVEVNGLKFKVILLKKPAMV